MGKGEKKVDLDQADGIWSLADVSVMCGNVIFHTNSIIRGAHRGVGSNQYAINT